MDVALIDMIDKDGNTILTQTNKFRGKDYTDDRYFDDDLIVYRWADLLLCVLKHMQPWEKQQRQLQILTKFEIVQDCKAILAMKTS